MSDQPRGQFYKGLLFGAVLGAVAGVLLAPEEGNKSRAKLKKRLEAAKKEYGPMLETLSKKAESLGNGFAPAVDMIKDKAQEVKKEVEKKAEPVLEEAEQEIKQAVVEVGHEAKKVASSVRRRAPRFFKGV